MRVLSIGSIILMQCIVIFSCNMLKQKEKVGELDKITNGSCKIQIRLKPNIAGWNIHIGDPFSDDFKNNIIEKNRNIMNKKLKLIVTNDSEFNMWYFSHPGEREITKKTSTTYFEGSLEDLISNTFPLTLSRTDCNLYIFSLEFKFEEKDIRIESPIPIVAEWHDAL